MEIDLTSMFSIENMGKEILNRIPDLILVKGPESHILWANQAFQDYYGMSNEELTGMVDSPISKPDYTLQYIKDDAYVFSTGKTLNIKEEPVTRHDGVIRYFDTIKSAVHDSSGKIIMTIGISRDVTEQKEISEILSIRDKALMTASEGILITSADAENNNVAIFANEGFARLTGYNSEEVLGKNCRFLQGENTSKETSNQIKKCITEHKNFEGEILNYKKDGTPFWNLLRITPVFNEKKEVTQFIGFQTDITQRKQAEQEMVKSLDSLKRMNGFMIDRELKMVELKKEIQAYRDNNPPL